MPWEQSTHLDRGHFDASDCVHTAAVSRLICSRYAGGNFVTHLGGLNRQPAVPFKEKV